MISESAVQKSVGWKPIAVFLVISLCLAAYSANPLLTFASLAGLILIFMWLWRPGEPPSLLFAMGYHWFQATLLTFTANLQGLPLEDMPDANPSIGKAAWLSLLGILAVSSGLRLAAGPPAGARQSLWREQSAETFSLPKLFRASLMAIVLAEVVTDLSVVLGGLRQPLLALANLHWVVVFILTYTVMARRQGYLYLLVVSGIEVVVGMIGYFSGFRTILIILVLGILATPRAFRGLRVPTLVAIGATALGLLVLWTGVKKEYRSFLNQGSGFQEVLVPVDQRLAKLAELVGALTPAKLAESSEALADRITYIRFFAESIEVVPDLVPHENGLLWWEALENALVPRALFPDKRKLDDSARTSRYTTGYVYGMQDGASISLGYVAESYIDFGPALMHVPLFFWGLFMGYVYRTLLRAKGNIIYNYGASTTLIVLNGSLLESSNVKIVGGLLLGFLVFLVFNRYGASRMLRGLSSGRPQAKHDQNVIVRGF